MDQALHGRLVRRRRVLQVVHDVRDRVDAPPRQPPHHLRVVDGDVQESRREEAGAEHRARLRRVGGEALEDPPARHALARPQFLLQQLQRKLPRHRLARVVQRLRLLARLDVEAGELAPHVGGDDVDEALLRREQLADRARLRARRASDDNARDGVALEHLDEVRDGVGGLVDDEVGEQALEELEDPLLLRVQRRVLEQVARARHGRPFCAAASRAGTTTG